jgi:hypothetical protein
VSASPIAQTILTLLCDSANIPRPRFFARAFSATRRPPKIGPKLLATLSPLAASGLFVGRNAGAAPALLRWRRRSARPLHSFSGPPVASKARATGPGPIAARIGPGMHMLSASSGHSGSSLRADMIFGKDRDGPNIMVAYGSRVPRERLQDLLRQPLCGHVLIYGAPLRRSVQRSGTIVTTPILSGLLRGFNARRSVGHLSEQESAGWQMRLSFWRGGR